MPFSPLFSDVDNIVEAEKAPGTIRSRQVTANLDILGDAKSPAEKIVLNLFSDLSPTVLFERSEINILGSYTWIGHIEESPEVKVILVVTDNVLMGSLSSPSGSYQIMPLGGDLYEISEIDQSRFPDELEPIEIEEGKD